ETALSVMQAISIPTWAALSTSGLKALLLPPSVREVIVLADGDEPGEKAAQDAAQRFVQQGRKVRIARPPEGKDFNDLVSDVA
ncbi:MAG: toprim domain-containing protein, partial [Hyphomicrobium sp.]